MFIIFIQGIYTCIHLTHAIFLVHTVLQLLFTVHITLFAVLNCLHSYISTFRNVRAVHNMAVFCGFLISCFSGTFLTYFLNDFEIVPVAPIITVILLL
jgi:hypothetical protein